MRLVKDNRDATQPACSAAVGDRFGSFIRGYGHVTWEVTSAPAKADDGTGKLFVWAKCIARAGGRNSKRPLPRTEWVHYLPLPNIQTDDQR